MAGHIGTGGVNLLHVLDVSIRNENFFIEEFLDSFPDFFREPACAHLHRVGQESAFHKITKHFFFRLNVKVFTFVVSNLFA